MGELDANASNNKVRTYVWGLDLSGQQSPLRGGAGGGLQSAGGVGGLLKVTDYTSGTTHHFVAYDGNGNVAALIDGSTGTATARYEYGPFGEATRATGALARKNALRFSTKYTDDVSGFLYYGYRYYNPSTGRWLSRDPIGEVGARNLYEHCSNDPLRCVDPDGNAPRVGQEVNAAPPSEASEPTNAECSKFPWWGKPIGITFCDCKPQLTAFGKQMPQFLQACTLRHEGVHAELCKKTGLIGCCIRALPNVRQCEEYRAYAESTKCAAENLANISALSPNDQLALRCYLASTRQNCKANKAVCDKWANKDGGPSCD